MVDVIVPTVAGREESLARLLESCEANTVAGTLNYIVIKDEETCGKAWRRGIELGKAPFLWLACDDLELTSPTWAPMCIQRAEDGQIPCPVILRPDGSLESCGGDMNVPHCLISELLPDGTVVDFAPSPFVSRTQIERIGMVDSHYLCDTFVSHKGRALGYETVICEDFQITHHHAMTGRRNPNREDNRIYAEALARG